MPITAIKYATTAEQTAGSGIDWVDLENIVGEPDDVNYATCSLTVLNSNSDEITLGAPGYGIAFPPGARITAIKITVRAKADSLLGSPLLTIEIVDGHGATIGSSTQAIDDTSAKDYTYTLSTLGLLSRGLGKLFRPHITVADEIAAVAVISIDSVGAQITWKPGTRRGSRTRGR